MNEMFLWIAPELLNCNGMNLYNTWLYKKQLAAGYLHTVESVAKMIGIKPKDVRAVLILANVMDSSRAITQENGLVVELRETEGDITVTTPLLTTAGADYVYSIFENIYNIVNLE